MEKTNNILGLLNPGAPSGGGGFFDSLAGPVLVVGVALALGVIIFLIVLAMHRDGQHEHREQLHQTPSTWGTSGRRRVAQKTVDRR